MGRWTKLRGNKNAEGVALDAALLNALRKRVREVGLGVLSGLAGVSRHTLERASAGLSVRASTAAKIRRVLK